MEWMAESVRARAARSVRGRRGMAMGENDEIRMSE
jgi:hypothetical protein